MLVVREALRAVARLHLQTFNVALAHTKDHRTTMPGLTGRDKGRELGIRQAVLLQDADQTNH
jgi:hypothetical protein